MANGKGGAGKDTRRALEQWHASQVFRSAGEWVAAGAHEGVAALCERRICEYGAGRAGAKEGHGYADDCGIFVRWSAAHAARAIAVAQPRAGLATGSGDGLAGNLARAFDRAARARWRAGAD